MLTVLSRLIMVLLLLPLSDPTIELLTVYDNLICVVFLFDFSMRLRRASPKKAYFIGERGGLDLIGSIPSFGILRISALLRSARLSRLARIRRLLRGKNERELVADVVRHRGQYAESVTILAAFIVLILASILVLQFESKAPDADITRGGSAPWWAIVTIATVGYEDNYPVTMGGRLVAVLVMLARGGHHRRPREHPREHLLPSPASDDWSTRAGDPTRAVQGELAAIREGLVALRRSLGVEGDDPSG